MKKVLVKKMNSSNSRDKRRLSSMNVRGFASRYTEYAKKQNKRAIVSLSATIAILLFILAFAITFPFQDSLLNRLFPKSPSLAAGIPPTNIQSVTGQLNAPGTQVSASWTAPTTNGNFLVAVLSANSGSPVTVSSAPANWIKVNETAHSGVYQFIYYYPNAPSQSGQVNFSLSSNAKASIVLAEYKDVEANAPLDTYLTTQGTSSTPTNSITPSQSERFIIHAVSTGDSTSFASPSAGFVLNSQSSTSGEPGNTSSALLQLYTTATNAINTNVTIATSSAWISTLLSFKVKQAATPTSATDWTQFQYNAQHTGRSSVQVNPTYSAKWVWMDKTHIVKNFVNGPNKSITDGFSDLATFKSTVIFAGQMQPITANGKTIFGAMNGIVYAVNSTTGDNLWDFTTGGPILSTAGYDSGVVIVTSMDGKVYGLNESNGTQKWVISTGAGINASPVIMNGTIYIGSRDGSLYAIDSQTGSQKWKYDVRDPGGKFNKSPIVSEVAVSEDGQIVLFGSENMYFYGLNASDGTEKWAPKQMVGQSFLYSWPVVVGNKVIVRTMSSLGGTEFLAESVLDGLPANPDWQTQEKPAMQNWLNTNPHQKSMYVLDVTNGTEPYQVAMGRMGGESFTPYPPVVDNSSRVLTYWRSRSNTFVTNGACFGTKYCPDISAMNMATGDRVTFSTPNHPSGHEIDNQFLFTVGGNRLYMNNHFRGGISVDLTSGSETRISTAIAHWDCGDFRGWGVNIIYYGNDTASTSQCNPNPPDPRPESIYNDPEGWSGISIAQTGSTKMLYITETNINAIVGVGGQ